MAYQRRFISILFLCCILSIPGVALSQQISTLDDTHFSPVLDSPALFVGWSPNASFISLSVTGTGYDGVDAAWGDGKLLWSTNGLWLGIGLPASLNDRLGVLVEGWVLVPGNSNVEASARGARTGEDPAISGNLDIDTTWFAIDVGGSYRVLESTQVIAGVRYDHLDGTMKAPESLERQIFQGVGALRPELDINLNSVFPYVGLSYRIGNRFRNVSATVKGFPAAISVAETHPKQGYFGELSIEASAQPLDSVMLSLFGRADVAYAVFEEFSDVAGIFGREPNRPATVSIEQALSVNWQQFIIGGRIGLNFRSPL